MLDCKEKSSGLHSACVKGRANHHNFVTVPNLHDKVIGMIKFLSKYVSGTVLDQIFKLYIRPHLDYGDIIYHKHDQHMTLDVTKRLEQTQYSAALATTGAWRGSSRRRLYDELGWEDLYHRGWFRPLCHCFNLRKNRPTGISV